MYVCTVCVCVCVCVKLHVCTPLPSCNTEEHSPLVLSDVLLSKGSVKTGEVPLCQLSETTLGLLTLETHHGEESNLVQGRHVGQRCLVQLDHLDKRAKGRPT